MRHWRHLLSLKPRVPSILPQQKMYRMFPVAKTKSEMNQVCIFIGRGNQVHVYQWTWLGTWLGSLLATIVKDSSLNRILAPCNELLCTTNSAIFSYSQPTGTLSTITKSNLRKNIFKCRNTVVQSRCHHQGHQVITNCWDSWQPELTSLSNKSQLKKYIYYICVHDKMFFFSLMLRNMVVTKHIKIMW